MSISNKISEIKIILSGLIRDLDRIDNNREITPVMWEELYMAADSIKQKINTIYTEYNRLKIDDLMRKEELEKILAARNEEIARLNQSIAELKRSFSDVTLNISKAFIPGSDHTLQLKESLTVDQEQEMEFIIENGKTILDYARGEEPDWMKDNPGNKVDTIDQAITLNDKLLFLKDLFNDDLQQYRLSLEKIDQMNSFSQVLEYTRASFPDWDEGSPALYRFYMTVRRRF